ncbi:TlpA family protein disulfide reductase [Geomonas silvestris]|uniref:TlpA family protein disulfide reductase n=1 Tax=Geomonas silvestris TaxID=2740184 RepID=UPI0016220108|nr:TlpA disulfide reductase family protein [Geomonas silvestris]
MKSLKKTWRQLFALLVLCSAFAGGCVESSAPVSGKVAPAISGNDVSGEFFSLGQQKGKLVVLYFWSRKCCGDSLRLLDALAQKYGYRGLSVVGIEAGSATNDVLSFVKDAGIRFVILSDEHGMLSRMYQVAGFPTIFLIGQDGDVQRKISGEVRSDQLEKLVVQLLPR